MPSFSSQSQSRANLPQVPREFDPRANVQASIEGAVREVRQGLTSRGPECRSLENVALGRSLRVVRELFALTQAKVAEGVGISVEAMSDLESGNRGICRKDLIAFGSFYDLPPAVFYIFASLPEGRAGAEIHKATSYAKQILAARLLR